MHRSTTAERINPPADNGHDLKKASFPNSSPQSNPSVAEPPINLAMMAVLMAGLTSCEGAPYVPSFGLGGLSRESLLSPIDTPDPLDPFFPGPSSTTTAPGYLNANRQSGLAARAQIHQWATNGFDDADFLHPNRDPLRLPSENLTQLPPQMLQDPLKGLTPSQFLGNVVDTYRVSRVEYATFQRVPKTEKVWDSVSDIFNSPTALANIGARELVRLLRKNGSGEDSYSNEVSDPLAGYTSPARWRPFGGDSALSNIYLDARPRGLSSDLNDSAIRFKVQFDLRSLFGEGASKNYVGLAYDTEGTVVFCHAITW